MLTRKFLTIFGIVGIVIMSILFILVVFKLVPTSWFLPLFLVAFVIWGSRLILRLLVVRKERRELAEHGDQGPVQTEFPGEEVKNP
jgi:hypothetical protein